MRASSRLVSFALVVALVATACSSSKKSTTPSNASHGNSTTPSATAAGSAYGRVGPYTVGVTTLTLPTENAVEVWYPAAAGVPIGSDTYDVRTFLPPAIEKLLAPSVHAYIKTDATRNAAAGNGKYPLVVFSHGYSGFRDQSSFLTTWLASWGMVVAAPDHPSRDLERVLAAPGKNTPTDVEDLSATIDLLTAANGRTGLLEGHVDLTHVALVGHSAGGAAIIKAAADPRVDGYASLASANSLGTSQSSTPPSTIPLPHKPSLFVAGANDHVVPPPRTLATFHAAPAPTYQWVIAGAGHNAFDDLCIAGQGQGGLIGLADKAGIGKLVPTQLRTLATDGCNPPDIAVVKTWPVIDQVVTTFLRNLFGVDRAPLGLGPSGTRTINGVRVTIAARPD